MTTFSEVLTTQLRRDPGRPLLTFYDHATDERVELSVTTYANWVAKAAGLLVEEGELERGMTLRLDLPPHWLSVVFLGAAWTVGLRSPSRGPDAVVCGPDTLGGVGDRGPTTSRSSPAACARWASASPSRAGRRPRRRGRDLGPAGRVHRRGTRRPSDDAATDALTQGELLAQGRPPPGVLSPTAAVSSR